MTATRITNGRGNAEGWPWGSNNPSRRRRLIVALLMAVTCGTAVYIHYLKFGERSDFSQALFGARALANGADPYKLVGPGRVYESAWPLMYPATTYAVALPFAPLTDRAAASIFVAVSTFLLAYGATVGSWHRLPMFASIAFTASVQFAQWSSLTTAMLFLPWLSFLAAAKPQAAFPILIASPTKNGLVSAALGSAILLAVSLALFPGWPLEWWHIARAGQQLYPPILRFGGPLIALVLLRWRRAEAWLVFLTSCMPQSWAWYNVLVLLAIPYTYREACVLSLVSSIGSLATVYFVGGGYSVESYPAWGAAMVAFAYLPATIAILRRPNVRATPPWRPHAVPISSEFG